MDNLTHMPVVPEERNGKKGKRGGKKNKKNNSPQIDNHNTLKIYYNNINGLISKKESLHQIMDICTPDIVALCETKLGSQSEPEFPGYEPVYYNCKRGKEGLLVAVRDGTFLDIEKVSVEGEDRDQNILAVQIKYPNFCLRVIVVHAPQETAKVAARENFFDWLKLEVERGQLNGDQILILGDMNGRLDPLLGDDPQHSSPNGESLRMLVDDHSLHIANYHNNTVGKWTRIQNSKKNEKKSEIDYIVVEESFHSKIKEMVIDEVKAYTPYWVTKRNREQTVVFSDHCAMMLTVEADIGEIESSARAEKMWRITEGGLKKYKEITSTRTLFFTSEVTTEMYKQWWYHLESKLDRCFKKKAQKPQTVKKVKSEGALKVHTIINNTARKGKIQREEVSFYRKRLFEYEVRRLEAARVEKLKQTLSQFSEDEKTPPNAYWKILKSVRGKKRTKISSVLKADGVETSNTDLIKNEIIKEFEHRLRNREPMDGWENFVQISNELVETLMTAEVTDGNDFTFEELTAAIMKMKKKKAPGPDGIVSEFLMEAGEGILLPLLDLFNKVKQSKIPPKQWNSVLITMIYKNKGSRKSLVNYRGIFLASVVSKVFERMLKHRIKDFLKKVDLCQAGARSERGPPDNIFILNAVIDHCLYMGKTVHVTTYDFEQAFDSLWLEDCILSLRKLNVPDYILQLIYNLNKEAVITVKTSHGPTPSASVKDIVQQGRVLAPDLCSTSTAEYCGSNKGIAIGTCIISSLAFVDDMLDVSESSDDAETAHLNATAFSFKKKLRYSLPKCEGMMINGRKSEPLPCMYLEGEKIKHVSHTKYLGDVFQQNGKNDELIKDRLGRGTKVMLKIDAIMAETQFGKHTLIVSLLLYRALFLASVLFNSQAWRNLTEKNFTALQSLQLRLLKKLVNAPSSISNSFLFLELGVLPIKYEIHQRQLTFLHHIVNLDEDDPVYLLYQNMKLLPGEPNWLNDVLRSAKMYGISVDENMLKSVSKETFKCTVRSAIHKFAFNKLRKECASQSKTSQLRYNTLECQSYLKLLYPHQAKTILQCRAQVLKIKAHRPFLFVNKVCRWCNLEEETLSHMINCGRDVKVELMDINDLDDIDPLRKAELISLAARVDHFLDLVDY